MNPSPSNMDTKEHDFRVAVLAQTSKISTLVADLERVQADLKLFQSKIYTRLGYLEKQQAVEDAIHKVEEKSNERNWSFIIAAGSSLLSAILLTYIAQKT